MSTYSALNQNDTNAVAAKPKGLRYLYALNPFILFALGSAQSTPSSATIAKLGLTHVVRVQYEKIRHSVTKESASHHNRRGDFQTERNDSTKLDILTLIIPPPPPSSPVVKRTQTLLSAQQLAAARDFLNLALPFQQPNTNFSNMPAPPAHSARVLLVAPAWHVIRDIGPLYAPTEPGSRRDRKCFIEMGEEFDPCAPFPDPPVETPCKAEMKVITDHSAAADIVAIVVCYISYITNENVGKVARNFEEEMWINGGRPDMAYKVGESVMFHDFKAPRTYPETLTDDCTTKRPKFRMDPNQSLAKYRVAMTKHSRHSNGLDFACRGMRRDSLLYSTVTKASQSITTVSLKKTPKYLEKRPPPILILPIVPSSSSKIEDHSFLSAISSPSLSSCPSRPKPLPLSMSTTHAVFWASRIDGPGMRIAQAGVHADGRDPKVVASQIALGLDVNGLPGWP